jgi:hypothetical protein
VGGTLGDLAIGGVAALARGGVGRTDVVHAVGAAARASHGIDWAAIVAQIVLWAGPISAIAAVVAIVPMFRNAVVRAWRSLFLRAGVPYSRYASHFAKVYGAYANPYLNREERLDLHSTYVPLSFRSEDDAQQVQRAAQVLADLGQQRTVIVGSPGSGKSTLLQAHGVGVLGQRFLVARRRVRVVPFLVRLRDLATFLDPDAPRTPGGNVIVEYLVHEVLAKEEFFRSDERAAQFLKVTLTARYALVMLDGLDEVPDDKLTVLLGAIDDFMTDGTEAHPTRRARILMTCRTQNFDVLRGGWVDSSFAPYKLCALAPLGDADVMAYLNKFGYQQRFSSLKKQPPLFRTEQGPRRFFDAIREDDKIDLVRVPLILAMAVSLYAEAPELIPSTIGKLYQDMVEEMLDRHSFRAVPDEADRALGSRARSHAAQRRRNAQSRYSLNEYQVIDKYSLLRQFALEAAKQTGGFGDFTRQSLEEFAVKRADRLNMAGQPEAFVEEIITHSGLLTSAGRDDDWHYAHRSIQEFLGAQELRLDNAAGFLLDRADSLDWRQAIQFYAVGQESQQIDDFLRALATRNPELAVRCLQACRPAVPAAQEVLDRLRPNTREAVTALAAATRCPLEAVRTLAIARLKEAILDPDGVFNDANLELEELLPLLDSLTRTNAADIAAVLPMAIERVPDDPRLARPLWQCLNADGFENHLDESSQVVGRLLRLAAGHEAFAELSAQERRAPDFLARFRKQEYPFKRGLDLGHNLVTLLAWAGYLDSRGVDVAPDPPDRPDLHGLAAEGEQPTLGVFNRFWAAKAEGRLRTLEDDKRRTISFSLYWPARLISGLSLLGAIVIACYGLATDPGQFLHPFGWLSLLLLIGLAGIPLLIFLMYLGFNDDLPESFQAFPNDAHHGNLLVALDANWNSWPDWPFYVIFFGIIPAAFGVCAVVIAHHSVGAEIMLAAIQFAFWITTMGVFSRDRNFYPYRPNPYVDAYDDPKSRHWLVPGARLARPARRPASARWITRQNLPGDGCPLF